MSLKANIKFIALATAGFSISSQAALYQVVQVVPDNTNLSSFGSAIQSGDINDPITGQPYSLGCFEKEANCEERQTEFECHQIQLFGVAGVDQDALSMWDDVRKNT